MDLTQITTLTGLSLTELAAKLDEELPKDAYSAVPGGAGLTDIDPNWMRKVLNATFGLCGVGWCYTYAPEDMQTSNEVRTTSSGGKRRVYAASLRRLRFWYRLKSGDDVILCEVDASGGSENSLESYAMKGAITNALGNAVSNLGFQESVYLGKRSHRTVGKKPNKAVAKPQVAKPTATKAPAPPKAAVPKATVAKPDSNNLPDFEIKFGQRAGQRLGDQPLNVVQWYANSMATSGNPEKEALKQAAIDLLAVKSNGKQPASLAG